MDSLSSPPETSRFPSEDLVPKKETNALDFVTQYPEYDGRNVIVGILDTGIDPGAHGLQVLPDGTPKLIDMVDCTGSGDVDVSTQVIAVKSDKGWELNGLSGRNLVLPADWNISSFPESHGVQKSGAGVGQSSTVSSEISDTTAGILENGGSGKAQAPVRLGIKRAYELFPNKLVSRVKQERLRTMNKELGNYVVDVRQKLVNWNSAHSEGKPTPNQAKIRHDLQARLDVLMDQEWQDDPGPVYDCVVFYDGTDYRAVIDVNEDGDFTQSKPMTDYRKERQFETFGIIDQFNYAVNIFDHGTVLSIVCDAGAHGSHVAGITAAYENERSGVAPGAQLISFKIGDSRLGSMETGTALTRALIEAVKRKCDVINLSYGEGCVLPNTGRFVKLAEDLVHKHNVIFVSSVGNNGPAISTVGAPGGTSSAILGVAAYVSPAMMKVNYSMAEESQNQKEDLVGTTFTWSSVGPTPDGANGVIVCAPGGAITSVPNWTLQKSMLMNGTSMSSPHAAGCVALLVSACKAEGVTVTPSRIYRAIENSAKFIDGLSSLQQGWGMIQVDKAWEYLVRQKDSSNEDVHFSICVENRSGSPRGVYLRQPDETYARQTFAVRINPEFRKGEVVNKAQRQKIDFEMKFRLEVTEPWVNAPEFFMLMNTGRSFKLEVDPTGLPAGLHTAKVLGYLADFPDAGAMFSLPVTVVRTLVEARVVELGELDFEPAEVKRFFLNVPKGAMWMDVTIRDRRADKDSSSRLMVLHTVQLLAHAAYRDAETQKYFQMLPSQTTVTSVRVHPGVTCEVALARYWSAIGSTKVDLAVEFRGVRVLPDTVQLTAGCGGACVRIFSDLQNESIGPIAKLNKWKMPVRPKSDGVVSPLGKRDVFPMTKKQIFQLVLTYEFTMDDSGAFIPCCPALQGLLYDAAYESQMMLIFDSDKKYLGVADSWPGEVKAYKGKITIRMQVRHDDPEMLEKLKDIPIWIERKIEKEIALSVYESRETMMIGRDSFKKRILRKGDSAAVFFAEPTTVKIPSSCSAGDVLTGTTYFGSGSSPLPGDGKRPGGYPILYIVGPKPAKSSELTTLEAPDERTPEQKMGDAVRDLRVDQLSKLTMEESETGKFEDLFKMLASDYPNHLPLLIASLKHVDTDKREEAAPKVIQAADVVIGNISEDDLALHFGKNHDKDDPVSLKQHTEMEKTRGFLIESLARKARAYGDMTKETDSDPACGFDATLKSLEKWVNIDSDKKFSVLALEKEKRAGRYGNALKLLNVLLKNRGEDTKGGICPLSYSDLLERRAHILGLLKCQALVDHDKTWRLISSPKTYALF